ncbi:phenylacetate--CoA ligase family protein [Bradyrhizobium sp.]|uniref:phenylacetate--CoA ligase family protein n=1 Tax=Bradyrhizobium sp. TaxID=376 RepID=UPI0025C157DF|nr:phenylacetate--CoA ligase family protein [Bradyrhizobium sp.]
MRARERDLAADMSVPFGERRLRSWNRLIDIVRFAAVNVPYYRDLFAGIGFDPELLVRDSRYLAEIPVLTKDIIRSQGDRMLRDDHADYRKHVSKTGGSTGPSMCVTYDQHAADSSSAVTRYARAQVGAGPAKSELHFAARFQDRIPIRARMREQIKCLANNRFNLTFASFSSDELNRLWQRINAIRPYLVHGHPSTLYQLALHVAARAGQNRAFRIFESSGEMLTQVQRDVIERVFKCKVINRYGLAEAGVLAYQVDPADDAMLFFDPVAWPEVVEVEFGGELPQLAESRTGELVVTPFANRMMPLIRYSTGDIATLREAPNGFYIQNMVGRVHDVVNIAGVPVPTHHVQDVLDRIGGIREFQIESDAHRPVFRIVPESDAAKDPIQHGLRQLWADSIGIEFIEAYALKLQGWRSKFHHLVKPPDAE